MRLTCPNCEAQYEVPDEVIPVDGRDVQCSNCGDTWFQHHPDHAPDDTKDVEDAQVWDAAPEPGEAEDHEAEVPDEDEDPEPVTPEPASPRELDPAVTDVLREEADRERAARRHEAEGLETQTELGLDAGDEETDKRSREAQSRMARLKGESEDTTATPERPGLDPGTRRNLLPDIDEINSSLSSDASETATVMNAGDMDTTAQAKAGFRRGFLAVVFLAVLGLLLYMFAPQLAEAVPPLEGSLDAYVEAVNQGRVWLDGKILGLMGTLDSISGDGG